MSTDHRQSTLLDLDTSESDRGEYGGPELFGTVDYSGFSELGELGEGESLRPINWNLLTGDEAMAEWTDLDAWVTWLRLTYGMPPTVVPPYWHRHDELVWELSALHTHWLNAYHPDPRPRSSTGTPTSCCSSAMTSPSVAPSKTKSTPRRSRLHSGTARGPHPQPHVFAGRVLAPRRHGERPAPYAERTFSCCLPTR